MPKSTFLVGSGYKPINPYVESLGRLQKDGFGLSRWSFYNADGLLGGSGHLQLGSSSI